MKFECKRCGKCCKQLISGGEVEVYGDTLEAWKKRRDLITHPLYDRKMSEFGSVGVMTLMSCKEFKRMLDAIEIRDGIRYLWGGILYECPFLKWMGNKWGCLLHGDAKPQGCKTWPMRDEQSIKKAIKIGCRGIDPSIHSINYGITRRILASESSNLSPSTSMNSPLSSSQTLREKEL